MGSRCKARARLVPPLPRESRRSLRFPVSRSRLHKSSSAVLLRQPASGSTATGRLPGIVCPVPSRWNARPGVARAKESEREKNVTCVARIEKERTL